MTEEAEEYGVPLEFVSAEEWPAEHDDHIAYTSGGKFFVREDFHLESAPEIVPHESVHAMRQMKFQPYLDLLAMTPDLLDRSQKATQKLLEAAAKHRGLDLFTMAAEDADMHLPTAGTITDVQIRTPAADADAMIESHALC